MNDIELAYNALSGKQKQYKTLFNYYDGNHPVMYTASRLAEIFRGVDARFTENWCAVVIDAVKDRINLRGVRVPNNVSDLWQDMWRESELDLESDDCHEDLLVAGESFLIVDNDGQAYHNDPRLAHVFYEAEHPRIKRFAAKWWVTEDDRLRMSLYYPERVENYISTEKADTVQSWQTFVPAKIDPVISNPLREIPVFHFRMSRRENKGDLASVVPVQNGINKLLADMMVAAEFGAFKQRFIITSADVQENIPNNPGKYIIIPSADGIGQNAQVGQFDATPLENYLKGIEQLAMSISSITRTPKHYFFTIGSNLSGESLQAMEAPMVKKAQDRIDRCIPVWREATRLMLQARGQAVVARDLAPDYDRPEVISSRTLAETREINVRAGVPLVTVIRDEGRDEAYIENMLADAANARDLEQSNLAQGLLDAQRRFNQG
jgi:hypothetical protein